jgi:6-O-methylguanine DNA methyltransferase, DNA binding domain
MKKGKSSASWRSKLNKEMKPKLVEVPEKWAKQAGDGKMLIPTPLLVNDVIKKIPAGKLATVNMIRDYLAEAHGAGITCPLTTGIFLNIAANAAEEARINGEKNIVPYWRVLKEGGILNPKFPGGEKQQAEYLKREGLYVITGKTGTKHFVKDYTFYLTNFR